MASRPLLAEGSDGGVVPYVEAAIEELDIATLNEYRDQIIQYFEDHPELTLRALRKTKKKKFVSEMVQCCGNKKIKGPATKLLKHLHSKIKSMSDEEISASESDAGTPSVSGTPRGIPRTPSMSISSRFPTTPQMAVVGPDSKMVVAVREAIIALNNTTLTVYREQIINYFRVNPDLTVDALQNINKKDFVDSLKEFCGSKNKLRGPAGKLYKRLKGMEDDESDTEITDYTVTATATVTLPANANNQLAQPILLPVQESGNVTDGDVVIGGGGNSGDETDHNDIPEQKYPESVPTTARGDGDDRDPGYVTDDEFLQSSLEDEFNVEEDESKYEIKLIQDERDWKDPLPTYLGKGV